MVFRSIEKGDILLFSVSEVMADGAAVVFYLRIFVAAFVDVDKLTVCGYL